MMNNYRCERDFEGAVRPYFVGDIIDQREFDSLTQKESLNFSYVDPISSLFPLEYYDDYREI